MYLRGHLLFIRDNTLFAQRFDPDWLALSGNPLPVVEHVTNWRDITHAVAASEGGTIIYRGVSGNPRSQFVWFDRSGKEIGRVANGPDPALKISTPAISPDGSRVALFRVAPDNIDVWFLVLIR